MQGRAPLIYPYAIDWDGRDEVRQSFFRACIELGADIFRTFDGPALSLARGARSTAFDVAVSRLVERLRKCPDLQVEYVPSRGYQPPPAIVSIVHAYPFDARVVQLVQRLISAAPALERAAYVLWCDFTDRTVAPSLPACGQLDRPEPGKLPILRLNATGICLLVADLGVPYPHDMLAARLRDLLTPSPQQTGPQRFLSTGALPSRRESARPVPAESATGLRIALELDPFLDTGNRKK